LADDEHRVWIIAIGIMSYAGGGLSPAGYQANFPLRTDLEPWNNEWEMHGPLRTRQIRTAFANNASPHS
jgi:hypothetical protein